MVNPLNLGESSCHISSKNGGFYNAHLPCRLLRKDKHSMIIWFSMRACGNCMQNHIQDVNCRRKMEKNTVCSAITSSDMYSNCRTHTQTVRLEAVNFHHLNIIIMTVSSWTSSVGFSTWRFPKIGLPPVLIHFHGNFPDKNHPFGDLWCSKTERQSHPQPAVS